MFGASESAVEHGYVVSVPGQVTSQVRAHHSQTVDADVSNGGGRSEIAHVLPSCPRRKRRASGGCASGA